MTTCLVLFWNICIFMTIFSLLKRFHKNYTHFIISIEARKHDIECKVHIYKSFWLSNILLWFLESIIMPSTYQGLCNYLLNIWMTVTCLRLLCQQLSNYNWKLNISQLWEFLIWEFYFFNLFFLICFNYFV